MRARAEAGTKSAATVARLSYLAEIEATGSALRRTANPRQQRCEQSAAWKPASCVVEQLCCFRTQQLCACLCVCASASGANVPHSSRGINNLTTKRCMGGLLTFRWG